MALAKQNPDLVIVLSARLRVQNTFDTFKKRAEENGFIIEDVHFKCVPEPQQSCLFHTHEPPIAIAKITYGRQKVS